MLAHQGDFKATFVPFGGTPPALNAVLGEHITIGFVDYPAVVGHIQSGKLRAVAVGSRARIPEAARRALTIAEFGLQGLRDRGLVRGVRDGEDLGRRDVPCRRLVQGRLAVTRDSRQCP